MSRELTASDFPLSCAIYWGMFDPHGTPESVTFDSLPDYEGYL